MPRASTSTRAYYSENISVNESGAVNIENAN